MENMTVCCRFRPLSSKEKRDIGDAVCVRCLDTETFAFKDGKEEELSFSFDKVFYEDSAQNDVYQFLGLPIVRDAVNAINGAIITYGQTGAGKTYSMEGPSVLELDELKKGLLQRVVDGLFNCVKSADSSVKYTIKLSMVEIYMEKVRDLLDLTKDNILIKESKVHGIWLSGATEISISDPAEALQNLHRGIINRAAGETQMNMANSRSHCIYIFTVHQELADKRIKTGKVILVDLAGSEEVEKTGAEGKVLEEAKAINTTLSALGNVTNALTSSPAKASHIPYWDSKLTRMLQGSLGGNSRTGLLCCCSPSPSNSAETLSTLRFGTRAEQIKAEASSASLKMAGVDVEMDDSGVPDFQSDMEQTWVFDIAGDLLGLEHVPELDPNAEPELEAETEQESEAEGAREGEEKVPEVIHCWSSGRYFHSTALMYSFSQRDDMEVLDEPLYANYLTKTGFKRPCRKEVLSTMESDGKKVIEEVIYGPRQKNYRFCKNISKQLPLPAGQASDLLGRGKHFILIRNPLDILLAYEKNEPPSFFKLGIGQLYSIYCHLCALDKPPTIIDAADLEQDPEVTLQDLCNDLDIEFDPKMLSWEAGPKPIDGPWASYRYKTVHQSTGFEAKTRCQAFPMSMYSILEQNLPFYSLLRGHMKKNSPPLNPKLLAWVDNQFVFDIRRAKVSVFDSALHGGDSVWEGLQVDNKRIFKLDEHLDRLHHSANALFFSNIPTREEVKKAILKTLVLNGMYDGGYIHLTLSRGRKATLNMRANVNLYRPTLIVFPKRRIREFESTHNIILVTVGIRREPPNNLDPEVRHGNLLRNELEKMEGKRVEAHAHALMVTDDGFVSETNDENIFMVKDDVVFTPRANKCLPGITRAAVMDLVAKAGKILQERDIYVLELYTADEIWTTGSEYVLTPVVKVDERSIGGGVMGPLTMKLQHDYAELTKTEGEPIPEVLY